MRKYVMEGKSPLNAAETKGRLKSRWILPLVALAVVIVAIELVQFRKDEPRFKWLAEREVSAQVRPPGTDTFLDVVRGLFELAKGMIGAQPQSSVNVTTDLIRIPSGVEPMSILGLPTATNSAGTRVWLLSAQETKEVPQRLAEEMRRTVPKLPLKQERSSQTQLQDRGSWRYSQQSKWVGASRSEFASIYGDGRRVSLSPRIERHGIRMIIGFDSWFHGPVTTNGLLVITNAPVYCSVLVPTGGAIVISEAEPDDGKWTNCLFVIKGTASDKNGKALELK